MIDGLKPVPVVDFEKQIRFGIAKTLTGRAKAAQAQVITATKDQFTVRTNWLDTSSPFGIKIVPADPKTLKAVVYTRAEWLFLHTTGGVKRPLRGQYLLVPSVGVPKTATGLIPKAARPGAIPAAKKFILQTKKGPIIAYRVKAVTVRKGPLDVQGLAVFGFEREAQIKLNDPFFVVISREASGPVFETEMAKNIIEAFETAK